MDQVTMDLYEATIVSEVVPALGCTEPIAIALAAAKAAQILGQTPEHLTLRCSGNIVKNAKAVTVPHSGGRHGLEIAGALGALVANADAELECLEEVTDAEANIAADFVANGGVTIELEQGVVGLWIDAIATGGGHKARVVLSQVHTHVHLAMLDGKILVAPLDEAEVAAKSVDMTIAEIIEFANTVDLDQRPSLREAMRAQVKANEAIAMEGLQNPWGAQVGRVLQLTHPDDVRTRARSLAAAGSDARMSGCALPVMINSGSGNQGMTVSLPVLAYARELKVSDDALVRSLLVSNLVAIHQKKLVGRLSAFCGAVSAAAGSAAGIAHLKGLSVDAIGQAVVNTLATSGGIVCDGAKPSCASKISVAVENATCGVDMAEHGVNFAAGDGIVGDTVEDTINNMARVARDGMAATDVEILSVMLERPKP